MSQYTSGEAQHTIPYQQLFESLPGMYLIITPDLKIAAVNDLYLKETYKQREELVGRFTYEVFPQDPQAIRLNPELDITGSFRKVLTTGKAQTMSILSYPLPDPENPANTLERYWQIYNSPLLDEHGKVKFLIHQVVNVTEKVFKDQKLELARQGESLVQKSLQAEKDRLERFIEQAPAIICVHAGPDFIFEKINPRYQQVFPGRELLGKPLLEGLPELAGTPVWDMVQQVYQTGETVYGNEVLIPLAPAEGSPLENKYYDFTYQARRDEHGEIDGIMVFAYDVTTQVEARNQLQNILDSMRQIVWTASPEGNPTFLNLYWYEYTGGSRDKLGDAEANVQLATYLHPDDGLRQIELWQQHLAAGKEVYEQEIRVKRAQDGMYRWHLNRAVPTRNAAGEITQWVGTATDIHEQKIAQELLAQDVAQFKFLSDLVPHLVWRTDANGYHDYFNQRWIEYTGYTVEDSLGTEMWNKLLHPNDQARARQVWNHSLATGDSYEIEYRFKRASDGMWRWFLARALPLRDESGNIVKWYGTCTDIHDQKLLVDQLSAMQQDLHKANQQLENKNNQLLRINQDLDTFVYAASHDLRGPVNNIEGLIKVLSMSVKDVRQLELLSMLDKSVVRLRNTLTDLTDVIKFQNDSSEQHETLCFAEIIEEVTEDIKELIDASQASITMDFQVACMMFSRKYLRSIFFNLLSNAIKYRSPERSPVIHISSEIKSDEQRQKNVIVLKIRDNGLGIEQKDYAKVFGMFKRLHKHVEGTGVGMYLVKKIVDNLGGRIELSSELGVGSTFTLYLPTEENP